MCLATSEMNPQEVISVQSSLRYPILLVHGFGFRDGKRFGYWGRIPKTLEDMGCQVFYGEQDGAADTKTNGMHLARRIDQILAQTGAEKVNIIAHSKGGLDSRYAISTLRAGEKVASLTTLATPHHGSETVDRLMELPEWLIRFVGGCMNGWLRLLGDRKPNAYQVFHDFTTAASAKFNEETPDHDGVMYQSYAFVMGRPTSDLFLWLPNRIVNRIEGENDGLLPPEIVKWGCFRGIYRSTRRRGVSHLDEIDFRRKPLFLGTEGEEMDILEFYRGIVRELGEMGF